MKEKGSAPDKGRFVIGEEGKKDLSSKGLIPLLKEQPLLGTEPYLKKHLSD